ncbi:MAG: hypothetical protein IPN60_08930 [Saprospiraceae bacterium]|nr:hypothetical protein [Candidatus Opimibacter skivensis]
MGKLIGVGGAGLTQLAIWAVLIHRSTGLAALLPGVEPGQLANMNSGIEIDPKAVEDFSGKQIIAAIFNLGGG